MKEYLLMLVGCILVNNYVMSQFLGICPFLGVSKKFDTALGMGLAVTFVMTLASCITWVVEHFLLIPLNLMYLRTIAFILVIAVLVQLVEMALKKLSFSLYQALGVYLPLITTNCAVLGVTLGNINNEYTFLESITNAFGTGIAFTLALLLFSGVRSRIENNDFPEAFKGVPATLIAAAIVSVSFMGFTGMM